MLVQTEKIDLYNRSNINTYLSEILIYNINRYFRSQSTILILNDLSV